MKPDVPKDALKEKPDAPKDVLKEKPDALPVKPDVPKAQGSQTLLTTRGCAQSSVYLDESDFKKIHNDGNVVRMVSKADLHEINDAFKQNDKQKAYQVMLKFAAD